MKLYIDSVGRVNRSELVLKRGDELELCLVFTDCAGNVVPSPWAGVVFGAKGTGEYEGAFLIYAEDFAAGVTCDGEVCLRGRLSLASSALGSLLGKEGVLCLMGEFEFSDLNCTVSSQLLSVRVFNDVIRGNEGTVPGEVSPVYALKSYVDGIAGKLVGEAMAENLRLLGDLVDEAKSSEVDAELARDGAEAAKNAAGEKAVSAMNSADAAAEALTRVSVIKVSVDSASAKAAQNVALAAQKAENAATSAAEALASKNAAQNVADSLGGEVAEAKQSAVEAKASATSAATSAATAKTEVGKIGNSVSSAQTAATNAQASATTASGHATTAGTKATQASTSATQAAASEAKAKASETASGISATNAANSATTASGHASTASTKATQAGTSATAASASATQAAGSVTAAAGHASTATTKATEAAGRATVAADYAVLAGTARDAAVTAKTAAEAAADRAEAASSGGVTDAQVNTKISAHNTSAAAHSVAMNKKLDNPTGGTVGQVLTKTTTGTAWSDAAGGGGGESTYKLNAINQTTAEHGVRHTHGHVIIEMLSMHTGSMEYPEWRLVFSDSDSGTDNQIVMSGGIGISTNDGSLSAYTSINGNVMDIGHDIVINGKLNASSPSVDIVSGSSITLVNDSYVGLEVSPQGDTIISGNTLTLKSGDLTKTLEDLINGGSSGGGGDNPAYMYSKAYNSGPDGKWEQLRNKNPPNGIYKVYIEAGGLHAPNGISITPSEILSSVSAKFTNGAAYGTASDGGEGVTNLFGHRFEHTPNIDFSHISYINVQFIYKKDSDGLQFLGTPGYVPTHEIDITVIMIPLANDYTPL